MKRIAFFLSFLLLLGTVVANAQTKEVSGTVTSAGDGMSIPGVSVSVKGTTLGTITDLDGNYTLKVPQDAATLVFSFVGMATVEEPLQGRNTVNVSMQAQTIGVDEVVVTALGISREKKSLGYAVQGVESEELVKAASPNVINSLAGKVAGVQINQAGGQLGASSRVVIRGNSSFGDNQPLIVVDGIPVSNSATSNNDVDFGSGLNDINPQDIESISVLKGGGAAALYGMRAGHGVILITTKSGKGKAKGISVTYDGNYNFDQIYGIQEFQDKYGQGYLGSEYQYKLAQQKGYTGSYQEFAVGGYKSGYGFTYKAGIGTGVNDGVDESWGPRMDIGLKIPQYNGPRDAQGNITPTPWVSNPSNVKDYFQIGHTTNHNLSLTSVNDNSTTRLSLGVRDQKGTLPNTDLKRYNAAVNSTMNFSEMFEFDFSLNYARTQSDNLPITGYNASNPLQSMGQWFGRQVDVKDLKAKWQTYLPTGMPYNWNSNYHNNPYWSLYKNTNSFQKDRVFGKASLFFRPTDYLSFEGRLGLDYYNSKNKPIVTYGSNEVLLSASKAQFHGGSFELDQLRNTELNADFIASFNKNFGDFSVNALAGANYRDLKWESSTLGARQLTVPDLFTISNVMGSPITAMNHSWIRSNSVYGSLSLGYQNWVYIDASVRNDWSSTIKDPFFYPAVSVSWLPLDAFEVESEVISYLKLRGGWSKVGAATSAYRTDPYFSAGANTIKGVTQYNQATEFPPASLKPEQVVTQEFGLEINFLDNRIGLDVAGYDKTTTDQIMSVAISKATGYNTTLVNAGEINNRGIEVQLNGAVIRNPQGFSWNVILNWARDVSEIVELYTDPVTGQELESYQIGSQWSTNVQARPGEGWGSIYGTGMLRRTSDGAVIVDEDGLPRTKANIKLGDVAPEWIGGIRNEFSYKNFSLGFLIDIRKGGDIFSVSNMFGAYGGQLGFTAEGDLRENGLILGQTYMADQKFVKIVGDANPDDIQKSEFAANDLRVSAQDFFESFYGNRELSIYDGSYGKLREAHLSYNLPRSLFGPASLVKGGSLSVVGTNLATLWLHSSNKAKIDPENSVGSGNDGVGLETTSYPPTRSFGLKLNLKF